MRPTLPQGSFYGKKQIGCEVAGISFTEYEFPPNLQIPPHSHESTYFYLVLRGAFTEVYGKKTRTGAPSTVIFSPAGERHSDVWHDRGGRCFNVEFEPEWMERVREHSAILDHPCDFPSAASVVRLATRLYREFQEPDAASPLALEGLTLEILAEASREPVSAGRRDGCAAPRIFSTISLQKTSLSTMSPRPPAYIPPTWRGLSAGTITVRSATISGASGSSGPVTSSPPPIFPSSKSRSTPAIAIRATSRPPSSATPG